MAVLLVAFALHNEPPQQSQASVKPAQEIKQMPITKPTVEVKKPEPKKQVKPQAPAPKPVRKVKPISYPVGCANYAHIIAKYNWNQRIASAVMKAESGCNPNAIGDNRVIGGIYAPSCGLMQIRTLKSRPSCSQLQNPETNIAWAYKLYASSGWSPWSVCRTTVSCY